jgi:hypothetical protein
MKPRASCSLRFEIQILLSLWNLSGSTGPYGKKFQKGIIPFLLERPGWFRKVKM